MARQFIWEPTLATIFDAVFPLFAVIILGFLAGKTRAVTDDRIKTLAGFVFNFAMPPMLFRIMANADFGGGEALSFVGAYFYGEALLFLLGAILAGVMFKESLSGMTIQAFGSSFSNGVLLGLPLLLAVFGDRGAVPALLVITLDVVLFAIVTILMEIALTSNASNNLSLSRQIRTALIGILYNPIVLSTVLGLAYGLIGFGITPSIDKTLQMIGQAAPPLALFCLGASMSLRRISGNLGQVSVLVTTKLLIHPIIAWIVVTQIVPLEPFWATSAVLFAAGPVGANVYLFAEQYGVKVATASTSIVISTGLSMLTITFLLYQIGGTAP